MRKLLVATTTVLTLAGTLAGQAPARAGDILGDAYSCEELWVMRNQIFKNAGYCFKTQKAISYFGNGGCVFADQNEVPLSDIDRIVVRDAKMSEARQGC